MARYEMVSFLVLAIVKHDIAERSRTNTNNNEVRMPRAVSMAKREVPSIQLTMKDANTIPRGGPGYPSISGCLSIALKAGVQSNIKIYSWLSLKVLTAQRLKIPGDRQTVRDAPQIDVPTPSLLFLFSLFADEGRPSTNAPSLLSWQSSSP